MFRCPPPFFKRKCSSDENLNKSGTKDLKCSNVCLLFLELKIMNVKNVKIASVLFHLIWEKSM